jgi:hypothetical protein
MKSIKIVISDDTEIYTAIDGLNTQIGEETKNSPEFNILYPQITACIKEYSEKAKRLARIGTTIHIQREFIVHNVRVLVVLDFPRKLGFFEKMSILLK